MAKHIDMASHQCLFILAIHPELPLNLLSIMNRSNRVRVKVDWITFLWLLSRARRSTNPLFYRLYCRCDTQRSTCLLCQLRRRIVQLIGWAEGMFICRFVRRRLRLKSTGNRWEIMTSRRIWWSRRQRINP